MTRSRETSGTPRLGDTPALRLYVAGTTPRSLAAQANLRTLCENNVPGRYEIEVIHLCDRRR